VRTQHYVPLYFVSLPQMRCLSPRRCVNKRKNRGKGASKGNKDDGHASSGYDSAASTGSCCCDHAEIGGRRSSTTRNTATNRGAPTVVRGSEGHDMSTVLRDGRVQALIEGLWTKVVSCLLLFVYGLFLPSILYFGG
jgi:hypothetical protein